MIAKRVYRRSISAAMKVECWARGSFILHVYERSGRWVAEVHDLRTPEGSWPEDGVFRSRTRAVSVGRKMMDRSFSVGALVRIM